MGHPDGDAMSLLLPTLDGGQLYPSLRVWLQL
jgi:hypothetical protein